MKRISDVVLVWMLIGAAITSGVFADGPLTPLGVVIWLAFCLAVGFLGVEVDARLKQGNDAKKALKKVEAILAAPRDEDE